MLQRLLRLLATGLNAWTFYSNPVKAVIAVLTVVIIPYLAYIFFGIFLLILLIAAGIWFIWYLATRKSGSRHGGGAG